MECYVDDKATGAACVKCGRPICNNHRVGNECKDRQSCREIVTREQMAKLRTFEAPHGRCWCDQPLVKHPRDAKKRPGRCPEHGYSTKKSATHNR